MTNLEAAIIAKEAQVKKLLAELEALKKAQAILDGTDAATAAKTPARRKRAGVTVGDRAVAVLRENGGPMHADDILARLKQEGFETSKPTLVSALLKDNQKRFKSLGNNIYELSGAAESPTLHVSDVHFENGNGVSADPSSNGHQSKFPLLQEVKSAVSLMEGDITQHAVFGYLRAKHPDATTLYPASVASALRRLTELGELEVIQESVGGAPKIYRKVEVLPLTEG